MATSRKYCVINKCSRWAKLDKDGVCPRHVALSKKDKGEVVYNCLECQEECKPTEKAMMCERCDLWIHASCGDIPDNVYDIFYEKGSKLTCMRYFCNKCDEKVTESIEKCNTLEQETATLKKDMIEVKADIQKINASIKQQVSDKVSDIMDDKKEIERRKMNLIVFGLPEADANETDKTLWSTTKKIEKDIEEISVIISEDLGVALSPRTGIIDARRIGGPKPGQPRPLKIEFRDLNAKRDVLSNAMKLRNSDKEICKKIYINPDLTEKQKAADTKLRNEMWDRRGKGENVIIRRGELVTVERSVRKTRTARTM